METTPDSREFRAERKTIRIQICENPRGQFLKITETSAGIDNVVIIPESGFARFCEAINELVRDGKPNETDPGS